MDNVLSTFLCYPNDFLYFFFYKFRVLSDQVSQGFQACNLREANDTYREALVELLWDQLGNDLFTCTVDCAVLVKQAHLVCVRPDEFGWYRCRRSWGGHDRMNACISWCNELRDTMGVKYDGLSR